MRRTTDAGFDDAVSYVGSEHRRRFALHLSSKAKKKGAKRFELRYDVAYGNRE